MREVVYHPAVAEELIQAAVYYERQCEGLGTRFLAEYDSTVREIAQSPLAWPLLEEPYRRHQLRHFPHGVIYRPVENGIRILALMHLHQRPGYWLERG